MGFTLTTRTAELELDQRVAGDATDGGVRTADAGRWFDWRRFLLDASKALAMTDPIAYGWYVVWTMQAQGADAR